MNKKTVGLIIILIFITGGFWKFSMENVGRTLMNENTITTVTPQGKLSTEGWTTCSLSKNGFEFKYPSEWQAYSPSRLEEENIFRDTYMGCSGGDGVLFIFKSDINKKEKPIVLRINIDNVQQAERKTAKEWIDLANKERSTDQGYTIKNIIVVGGQRSYVRMVNNTDIDILLVNPDKSLLINMTTQKTIYPQLDITLETILSTFKFI